MAWNSSNTDYLIAGLLGGFVLILYVLVIVLFVLVSKLRKQINRSANGPVQQRPLRLEESKYPPEERGYPQRHQTPAERPDDLTSRGFQEYPHKLQQQQGYTNRSYSPPPQNPGYERDHRQGNFSSSNPNISYGGPPPSRFNQGPSGPSGYDDYPRGGAPGGGHWEEPPQKQEKESKLNKKNAAKAGKFGMKMLNKGMEMSGEDFGGVAEAIGGEDFGQAMEIGEMGFNAASKYASKNPEKVDKFKSNFGW